MDFEAVIGLEVHIQLLTQSKIFCGCSAKFGALPNHHTCPVCTGMPGSLPVLNRKVVDFALRLALYGCKNRPFYYIVASHRKKARNRGYYEQARAFLKYPGFNIANRLHPLLSSIT